MRAAALGAPAAVRHWTSRPAAPHTSRTRVGLACSHRRRLCAVPCPRLVWTPADARAWRGSWEAPPRARPRRGAAWRGCRVVPWCATPRALGDFLPFEEARAVARAEGLRSQKQWQEWCSEGRRPARIPAHPHTKYADAGWLSWADWLGYGAGKGPRGTYLPFAQARATAQALGLQGKAQWEEWCRRGERPPEMPSRPDAAYRDQGWRSWADWLGYRAGAGRRGEFLPFHEARAFVREHNLPSVNHWWTWCREGSRPHFIPSQPHTAYRDEGWVSWADWLGYGAQQAARSRAATTRFKPFTEARAAVRKEGLQSTAQWQEWCAAGKRPADVPSSPDTAYRDEGWLSWADWLGYGAGRGPVDSFLPFEDARKYARAQGLRGTDQWREWCSQGCRPADVPAHPERTYCDEGWLSWADWLGYGAGYGPASDFLPFEEARAQVRRLQLRSVRQWREWSRSGQRPRDIPSNPNVSYRGEGWLSWPDWLGYGPGREPRQQ